MPSFGFPLASSSPRTTGIGSARTDSSAAPTDHGFDLTTWAGAEQTTPDLDPSFRGISGQRAVSEAVARRLCTPRGFLPDDDDAGFDLRRHVHGKMSTQTLLELKTAIEREAEKDERVFRARASLVTTAGQSKRTLDVTASVDVETMFGTFPLVLAVSDVSISILRGTT